MIEEIIPREPLVEEIREIIIPAERSQSYSVVFGEHGTGKTSLITLAVNGMGEPKGIVYLDIPHKSYEEANVVKALQTTLGWSPDQIIDSEKCKYSSSFQ